MNLETVFFNTKVGSLEFEFLHNLDEYELSLLEMAKQFAIDNVGLTTGTSIFSEYVQSKGNERGIDLICILQGK